MTVMRQGYPIFEHDPSPEAFIEPSKILQPIDIASHCVLCFFQEVIDKVAQDYSARTAFNLQSEMGIHPLREISGRGVPEFVI